MLKKKRYLKHILRTEFDTQSTQSTGRQGKPDSVLFLSDKARGDNASIQTIAQHNAKHKKNAMRG